MIRRESLSHSMSSYLVERISATPNIELMPETELVDLEGSEACALQRVVWQSTRKDAQGSLAVRHLFLFLGADPASNWLAGSGTALDRSGFIRTGPAASEGLDWPALQTSIPGVFAIGDARAGSVKRVGGAIGEGAQVIQALHAYLADRRERSAIDHRSAADAVAEKID